MTAAMRAVPCKRRQRSVPTADLIPRPVIEQPEDAQPSVLARLWDAVKPESSADATLLIGLALLGVSVGGIFGSLFWGLLPPAIVLTFVALLAYLRPAAAP